MSLAVLNSLKLMLMGMCAIFVVMFVIYIAINIMLKVTNKESKVATVAKEVHTQAVKTDDISKDEEAGTVSITSESGDLYEVVALASAIFASMDE